VDHGENINLIRVDIVNNSIGAFNNLSNLIKLIFRNRMA